MAKVHLNYKTIVIKCIAKILLIQLWLKYDKLGLHAERPVYWPKIMP
jgi:hypothetical protein